MSSIIVVEGIHDEMRIKSIFPQAQVLTTNGREIDPNTLSLVKKLSEDHSIIVLTDPDGPGEKNSFGSIPNRSKLSACVY